MNQLIKIFNNLSTTYKHSKIYSDGENFSFQKLHIAIQRKISEWEDLGINSSTVVLIPSKRGLEFFIELFTCWAMGAIAVPLGDNLNKNDVFEALKAPDGIINSNSVFLHWHTDLFSGHPQVDTILFTSGTSGVPKGVMHNHNNILGNSLSTLEKIQLYSSDTLFFNIPYHFTSAISHFVCGILSGANICALETKLFPKELIAELNNYSPNCFGGSPIQLLWIANTSIPLKNNFRLLMSSGDDLPSDTILTIFKKFPYINLYVAYGLTEIGGRGCIFAAHNYRHYLGSVGIAISGLDVRVMNEAGNSIINETGEVFYSGSYLFCAYIKQGVIIHPKATTGFPTGDVGYINKDGFLFLIGRNDEVFKVAGKKVSALVIRRSIIESGLVTDAAVIPITTGAGTLPIAAVVFSNDVDLKAGKLDLLKALRNKLPTDHIPKEIITLPKIPRTESGKIIKTQLKDIIQEMQAIQA